MIAISCYLPVLFVMLCSVLVPTKSCKMIIRVDILRYMSNLVTQMPRVTPHRDELIVTDILKYVASTSNSKEIHVDVKELGTTDSDNIFQPTKEIIQKLIHKLPRCYTHIDFEGMVKVLLPETIHCCQRKLRIDPRSSSVIIYTDTGIKECLNFHGTCNVCKRKYYHSYLEDTDHNRCFSNVEEKEYFVISRATGFCTKFLTRITHQIVIGAVSFEKICEMYNAMFNLYDNKALSIELVENNWLLYMIAQKVSTIPWSMKTNNHVDVEKICTSLYPELKNIIDDKWRSHICNEIGCQKRMVVVDGNEKLYRYCCSFPIEKVIGTHGNVNQSLRCINNPLRGNQNQKGNKRCAIHLPDHIEANREIVERVDFRPITRAFSKQLEIEELSGEGCKDKSNLNKHEERTAGMLYLFRSCGIRIAHYEMYTSESLSSVFSSLNDTFAGEMNDISGIVYDRACDLQPYLRKLAASGNDHAYMFANLRFIVDIFHAEKHTMPKCTIGDPQCLYHPDLEMFADVRKMNMEIAESSFHVLNCYKHSTRGLTYGKRLCLLKFVDDQFNLLQEKKRSLKL